jgi:uncharacterized membrane protein YgcG
MSRLSRSVLVAAAWLVLAGRAAAVAPEIKDEGKFFSPEAVKKANEQIREIFRKTDKDLLIETFPSVPSDQVDRVKRMSREEKVEFFRKWAQERAQRAVVNGVYILVCKDPTYFRIEVSGKGRGAFDSKAVNKLEEGILSEFRDKRFDEGLMAAVKFVGERFGAAAR